MTPSSKLTKIASSGTFPTVRLVPPSSHGFVVAAFEIDHRPPFGFVFESSRKRSAITRLRALVETLRARPEVAEATLFKALVVPPGRGAFLAERPQVPIARFDLVLLIETGDLEAATGIYAAPEFLAAVAEVRTAAKQTLVAAARNGRRIGPVDHDRDGIFLFNFFYADDLEQNLAVWEYTAGWFSDQTGLDNSTLLVPEPRGATPYTVINHCRWDRARDILPALLFNPTFRSYVLRNFEANNTAAMPILYRRA